MAGVQINALQRTKAHHGCYSKAVAALSAAREQRRRELENQPATRRTAAALQALPPQCAEAAPKPQKGSSYSRRRQHWARQPAVRWLVHGWLHAQGA